MCTTVLGSSCKFALVIKKKLTFRLPHSLFMFRLGFAFI